MAAKLTDQLGHDKCEIVVSRYYEIPATAFGCG